MSDSLPESVALVDEIRQIIMEARSTVSIAVNMGLTTPLAGRQAYPRRGFANGTGRLRSASHTHII